VAFAKGDVLVGLQPGTIRHYTPAGVLIDTDLTGGNSFVTGMAFDASGNLYATAFDAQNVFKFDNKGRLGWNA
jgi:outer membrane protein assembly factor BamB